jgi:alkylated DNA repair dioxygenase AlkB
MEPLFKPLFLSAEEASHLLQSLNGYKDWSRGKFIAHQVPRDEMWFGPFPYKFSQRTLQPIDWTTELVELRARVEAFCGSEFNSVLLNRYRDGKDSVDWHADDEPEMSRLHPIASISLGGERIFTIKENGSHKTVKYPLSHGSIIVMPPGFQATHKHRIPKTTKNVGMRINLTFRHMKQPG